MRSNEIISSIVTLFNTKFQGMGFYFKMSSGGESYYMVANRGDGKKPVQIRISNHGTYVKTWVDLVNKNDSNVRLVDPSVSINFSIVFIDNGNSLTYDCEDNQDCNDCSIPQCVPQQVKGTTEKKHTYQVMQYVYDSSVIKMKYIQGFVNMLYQAVRLGRFNDPLRNAIIQQGEQPPIERKAKPKQLKSVFIKEALIRSIVREALLDMAFTYSINESNTKKDMKQNKKTINEAQLRAIVKEAVKSVLKENGEVQQSLISQARKTIQSALENCGFELCEEYTDESGNLIEGYENESRVDIDIKYTYNNTYVD